MPNEASGITYSVYQSESQIDDIKALCEGELSEPYSIFTYRYFLVDWPHLCYFAHDKDKVVGVIVCKQDRHKSGKNRGYIAMLSVLPSHRKLGIASTLVDIVIQIMIKNHAEEIVLETEVDNLSALALYEKFGFLREKRLHAFYLNRKSAFRLVLPIDRRKSDQEMPDIGSLTVHTKTMSEMIDAMYI